MNEEREGMPVTRSRFLFAFLTGALCFLPSSGPASAFELDDWYPILNAKFAYPQDWSAEIGAYIGKSGGGEFSTSVTGVFVSAEPGGNGIKVNAGYGSGGLSTMIPVGLRGGLSYYRAWNDDHSIGKGEDFVGVQAAAAFMFATASLGAYYNPDEGDTVVSAGIGIGW